MSPDDDRHDIGLRAFEQLAGRDVFTESP